MPSRFAAFWEEFWKSISWTTEIPEKSEKLKKGVPFVLWLLAAVGYGTKDVIWASWWPWLEPWSPLLLVAVVWFVAWKAGIAWYKTQGPIIWMGEIETDESYRFFEFFLENRGKGEVFADVYATDLRDGSGRRVPIIDGEMKIHCRGYYTGDKVKLFGDKHVIVAPLQVHNGNESGTAHLRLVNPGDKPNFWVAPLISHVPTPLKDQHELSLSIRVDFFDEQNKFLTTRTRRLVIVPDEKQSLCYRVLPTK
jgi:hypothetical protein